MNKDKKKLTPSQRKALKIIREHGPIRPREFAYLMWPDSDGHKNHTKCGYGTTRGGGMYLAGGGYLGKLRARGLIKDRYSFAAFGRHYTNEGYVLTKDGEHALLSEENGGES